MNLEKASKNHLAIVSSFACLLVFAKLAGIAPNKENSAIVTIVAFAFFIWHGISIFFLAKNLDKNKFFWAALAIFSPTLLFIPSVVAIVSANKIFKKNGWKVKFYGGATPKEQQP